MNKNPNSSIVIFTDGACSGNPGPGGWGSIVALPDGSVRELGGSHKETTNNRMEMAAAIHALQSLANPPETPIIVYTDSVYLIRGITQWIFGWRARGWKNAEGKDVANRELWEELSRQVARLKPAAIEWKYVRGHAGYPGNERCDVIAVSYSLSKPEPLYVGSLDGYFVDLNDLPVEEALPESKKPDYSKGGGGKSGSGASGGGRGAEGGFGGGSSGGSGGGAGKSSGKGSGPVSYLSYHNGVVERHSTWAECERRVKGQSNAKFKKAKSSQEEREILSGWGVDPSTVRI